MSTIQQVGLVGNSVKVQRLPAASAATYQGGNRFYTLVGSQEGYITGHTYHTILSGNSYLWEDATSQGMLTVSSESEMTTLLANENTRKYVRYVGESGTYIKDQIYELVPTADTVSYYELPTLANEGTAADLVQGKQLIDSNGKVVEGIAVNSEGNLALDLLAKTITDINDTSGVIKHWPIYADNNSRVGFCDYCSQLSRVNLPSIQQKSSYDNYIPSSAFYACKKLEYVDVGSIRQIQPKAFFGCTSLKEIKHLDTVTNLYDSVFYYASFLSKPKFEGLTRLSAYNIFNRCQFFDIDETIFPNVSFISGYAMFYCATNVTKIELPKVTFMSGNELFYGTSISSIKCDSLTMLNGSLMFGATEISSIDIPTLTNCYGSVFARCEHLVSVKLPSLEYCYSALFSGCGSLSTVIFKNVSALYSYAFYYCRRLLSLYLLSSSVVTLSGANIFYYTPISDSTVAVPYQYGSVYVPLSLLSSYKADSKWSVFSARLVGLTDDEISRII